MISFIIPAYNEEKYIARTLRHIPNDFEKIVVCNGCSDNTYKKAKRYSKVINLNEKNVSKARNLGAKLARNNFFVFLDADTKLSKKAFSELIKLKGKKIVGTFKAKFDKSNLFLILHCTIKNILPLFGFHNASGVIFCSKEVFNKAHGFNEKITKGENWDFVKRAKKYAKSYFSKNYSITSSRRFEKIGYAKVLLYWLKNIFIRNKDYPSVR